MPPACVLSHATVAQLVEQQTFNLLVMGSSPVGRTIFSARVLIRHGKVPEKGTRWVQVLHLADPILPTGLSLMLWTDNKV